MSELQSLLFPTFVPPPEPAPPAPPPRMIRTTSAAASGHQNVYYSKSKQKWHVNLMVNTRRYTRGGFLCIEDAIRARDKILEAAFKERI